MIATATALVAGVITILMGLIVLEGLIITVVVLTGFRTAVFRAVPQQLKIAISVGIDLFIALIGLVDSGFVRYTSAGPVPVTLGDNGTLVGVPSVPSKIVDKPNFGLLGHRRNRDGDRN